MDITPYNQQPQPLFNEILSGGRKLRVFTSLVISALVTAAVVAPMAVTANAYEPPLAENIFASAEQILVDTPADSAEPLGSKTVSGNVLISLAHPNAAAVSFAMAPAGGENIEIRTDGEGPRFDFYTDALGRSTWLDTTRLEDGPYEIRVTVTTRNNEVQQAQTSFFVDNGSGS